MKPGQGACLVCGQVGRGPCASWALQSPTPQRLRGARILRGKIPTRLLGCGHLGNRSYFRRSPMRKTLTASLMMVGLVVMGAPAMGAFVVIDDDFSSYPIDESLVGKTAPTGQTLEALPDWTTFAATRPWGIGGNPAMGLGLVDNDPGATQSDNLWYPFGMTLEPSDDGDDTNAILTVQWDAKHGEDVGGFWSLIQVAVLETKDNWENVVWSNYHTGPNSANGQWRPCATGW